jgi:hypothetical protein
VKDLRQYKSREWFAILGGEDRIYVKRDWFGTVMDKNYGVTNGNERLMGDGKTCFNPVPFYFNFIFINSYYQSLYYMSSLFVIVRFDKCIVLPLCYLKIVLMFIINNFITPLIANISSKL